MSYTLLNTTPIRQTDANGIVAPGALLYTYQANTTTPQATYTDATGTTPLSNPVVADGTGLFPEIWLSPLAYDLACYTSTGTLLWTASGIAPTSTTSGYTPLSVTGTDTIVGTFSPGISSYVAGQQFQFQAAGNNTTTSVTINISGLGPQPIKNPDGTNLAAGDIVSGQIVQLYYTGSFFQYVNCFPTGRLINIQIFTATGTYTPTLGTRSVVVMAVGGGGAGGGTPAATGGNTLALGVGGSSGSFGMARFTSGFSGVTVTVGAAGVGSLNANGTDGGASSFGSLLVCPGGIHGQAGTLISTPSNTVVGGGNAIPNAPTGANIFGKRGKASNACVILGNTCIQSNGADSPLGGGGYTIVTTYPATGGNGDGYGSGGGGSVSGIFVSGGSPAAGGNGAPGVVIVYEYS